MRSPAPTTSTPFTASTIIPPGNPNILEKIWQSITSFVKTPIQGQQRPLSTYLSSSDATLLGRQWDLEIIEPAVRNVHKARQLIQMYEYCPEVATAINEISDSVWSSDDGDDEGFTIAPTLNDYATPIDPTVEKILGRLINDVIGGINLELAAERSLIYGDAFAAIGVDPDKRQIERVLFLPTWEMFRVEDNKGQLLGFQQRRYTSDIAGTGFHPLLCVHWRYRRKVLYGRSLFYESIDDWEKLKAATEDLAAASRAVGINPNLHIMPSDVDEDYRADYKRAYEAKRMSEVVTDFYLMNGADVRKVASINPDLTALANNVLMWRSRIVMRSRVPPWLLGLPNIGAREIAGQPTLAYARFINRIRMTLTDGIRHLCDLELALNGIPKEQWQYRIIWPKIATNPYAQALPSEGDPDPANINITDLGI